MERQIERLKLFCSAKGYILDEVYSEIGSALNYSRKKYIDLYGEIASNNVERIILEYKDRFLRIGFEDFERFCAMFNTEIIIVDNSLIDKTKQQEITEDLISIIHHFSMRIYSNKKLKKIVEMLEKELNSTENTEKGTNNTA